MVTGGTGFAGSHTAAEPIRSGHEVRLLVRKKERIHAALGPLGFSEVDFIEGDVTEPSSVEKAAERCDTTVHADRQAHERQCGVTQEFTTETG